MLFLIGAMTGSGNRPNGDGTGFKWFDIRSVPAEPGLVMSRG